MKSSTLVLVCLLCLCLGTAAAQNDTIKKHSKNSVKGDSINNELLNDYTKLLNKAEQQRIADSVRKLALLQEIDALKNSDLARKQKLEKEIKEMAYADSVSKIQRKQRLDSLKLVTKGFPVAPFNDTLFFLFTRIGPFTPSERAEAINEKIKLLEESNFKGADSLYVYASERSYDLMSADKIILSITDEDALWQDKDKKELAHEYKTVINEALLAQEEETGIQKILIRAGMVLLVILVLWIGVYFINKFFRYVKIRIENEKGKRLNGFKIKNYEFLDAERQVLIINWVVNVFRVFIILLLLYIALPVIFSIFPWTKNIATTLFDYILSPLKRMFNAFIDYIPNVFTILVIYFTTQYVIRFLRYLATEIEKGTLVFSGFYQDWAKPTFNIIKFLLYAFMFIIIFPYLPGSSSPVFQGVSVFIGVLFSFGSSSAISNTVAGIVITYMRPFKVGDRVRIGDVTGDVIEKTMLVTRVRTIKNEEITIPNATVMNGHTINYTTAAQDAGLIVHSTITIGYDVPWRQVHQLLIDAVLTGEYILKEPKPFVLQTSLDDFYVSYQVNAYTKTPQKQAVIYSQLHQAIQDKFNEAGVEIMSSHYSAIRDGNQTTIPGSYLPPDYQAPSFRIEEKK